MKSKRGGKIEKPEDKTWKEWYNKLDNKDHEKILGQLGLDKGDIEEWEQHTVFQDLEAEASGAAAEKEMLKAKKFKRKK